jgi:ubiquinone/menaquinone biosynthesis C-methylase UbiE
MRTLKQKIKDFITFPLRALTIFYADKWGLSSLATERFDYVSREVRGRCLDIGCGIGNRFIKEFCQGKGVGIDLYLHEGLTEENIVPDMTHLPFEDESFDTVTFIANLNHIPIKLRDAELREASRVLSPHGKVVITMGNPLAELVVHKVVWFYDVLFNAHQDIDNERGMAEGEEYFVSDREIFHRLQLAGFCNIKKKYFWTQWGLNHLFVANKQ